MPDSDFEVLDVEELDELDELDESEDEEPEEPEEPEEAVELSGFLLAAPSEVVLDEESLLDVELEPDSLVSLPRLSVR